MCVFTQTLQGTTLAAVAASSFPSVLESTLSTVLGAVAKVNDFNAVSTSRRLLGTEVNIQYTMVVISYFSSGDVMMKLNAAVSNGNFATTLNKLTGMQVTAVTNVLLADASPTTSPTNSPNALSFITGSQSKQCLTWMYSTL